MKKQKICLYCGKTFKFKSKKKKYCNTSCQMLWRYHNIPRVNKYYKNLSREQNIRRRKNPVFRKKEKIYFDKWRKQNREHFNDLIREKSRIWEHNIRIKRNLAGLCLECGSKRDEKQFKTCLSCRIKRRIRDKKWR